MRKPLSFLGIGGLFGLILAGMILAGQPVDLPLGVAADPSTTTQPPAVPTPTVTPNPAPIAAINGPTSAKGTFMVVVTTTPGARDHWSNIFPLADGKEFAPQKLSLRKDGDELWIFQDPPAGAYIFRLRSQVANKEGDGFDPIEDVDHVCVVGAPVVDPKPDTPPTDPVTPPPVVDPSWPITEPGLMVLITYESDNIPALSTAQADVIDSNELHKWLVDNCDGGFRRWDISVPVGNVTERWKKAASLAGPTVPKLLVSNGKTGIVKEIPKDVTVEWVKAEVTKYKLK